MACDDNSFGGIAGTIPKCDSYAGMIATFVELCTRITALEGVTQENVNGTTTTLVAATQTILELSDVVTSELPAGSLVGDTVVAQQDGSYFINVDATIPTSGVAEQIVFEILVDGTAIHTITLQDDGLTALRYANTFNLNLTTNQAVSVAITSPTGGMDATAVTRLEFVV